MSAPTPIDGERLLEHAVWIRDLARTLVADVHLADDLAQDTCVAALERPPADGSDPRGWLATVLLNFHRQRLRARSRRSEREEWAALSEAQPATLDVLERAAQHRELYEAVMSLSEPNRTAILLRFFDGLPQRKIAAQLDVPVSTVHSRVQRGLVELRGRLTRPRGGDARSWVLALLPLAKQGGSWTPGALGALLMDLKVKVALGIALVACGVIGVWPLVREPSAARQQVVAGADVPLSSSAKQKPAAPELFSAGEPSPERVVAGTAAVPLTKAAPEASALPAVHVRGRVLDPQTAPLGGVHIAFDWSKETHEPWQSASSPTSVATSDARGVFELEFDAQANVGEFVSADPELATLLGGQWRRGSSYEPVVVVAGLRPLAGVVRDEEGVPLAGARITLRLDAGFESRFAQVLDASKQHEWRTESNARGEFALPSAPAVDGARLSTTHEGHVPDERVAPDHPDPALEIVLRRPRFEERAIEGVVIGPQGEKVEGARILLGSSATRTGRDGRFVLELKKDDPATLLRALAPGYLPAELLAAPLESKDGRRWPAFVTLKLGDPSLSLAGKVVDEEGHALAGIRVWLADPTYFGEIEKMPTQVENVLAGSKSSAEIEHEEDLARELRGRDMPNLFWTWAVTDSTGRFRLDGLLARDYRLKAMNTKSLVFVEAGPFSAGSEAVRLVLQTHDQKKITGRVVTHAGEPVSGVRVQVDRTTMKVTYATPGGSASASRSLPGASTTTGDDGRFVLEGVPSGEVFLSFEGDAILPDYRDLDAKDDAKPLEVVVTARCHFQVELADPVDRADRIAVVDAQGERLQLHLLRGDYEESAPTKPLSAGRSAVIAVGDNAAALVLLRGEAEIERHPIVLLRNTLNKLRF